MDTTDENKAKTEKIGGIEAVIKAISIHPNSTGVCKWGCSALRNVIASGKMLTTKVEDNNWLQLKVK